ncbi:MAG: FBP domain-containing protein [Myxococcus sp.]|nr:FBP domain-containing protein [Myxococcus sp.]
MFKLDTPTALLDSFRPKDRRLVDLPSDLKFPLAVKDYLAWTHPGGGRVFIVFATPGGVPTGIAFDSNAGSAAPAMCSWCHTSSVGTGVGLLVATLNNNKRVGVMVCSDLSCREKLEEQANRAGASVRPAMEKLMARVGLFASDALKIDLSGAGR